MGGSLPVGVTGNMSPVFRIFTELAQWRNLVFSCNVCQYVCVCLCLCLCATFFAFFVCFITLIYKCCKSNWSIAKGFLREKLRIFVGSERVKNHRASMYCFWFVVGYRSKLEAVSYCAKGGS